MTYLNSSTHFDLDDAEEVGASAGSSPSSPHFSGLEWSVVALARRDRIASLREPGRIAKALREVFGTGRPGPLADGRLEALRRIAVLAWHYGYAVPVSELRAFLAAGFSSDQYEMLQTSIARGRAAGRDIQQQADHSRLCRLRARQAGVPPERRLCA